METQRGGGVDDNEQQLRVPRRSSGRIKGVTTVEDLFLCLFILLLKSLNVHWFPPPSRSTNCVTLVPKCKEEGNVQEEGGTLCQRALALFPWLFKQDVHLAWSGFVELVLTVVFAIYAWKKGTCGLLQLQHIHLKDQCCAFM